jgi:hypothetical protein
VRGVRRLPDGGVRVRIDVREHEVLRSLPDQLRSVLRGDTDFAVLRDRLFPRAYDDPEHEREYRELVGDSLAEQRLEALEAFARTLEEGHARRLIWTVDLSAQDADAWLSVVNDLRLTLGTLVGITKEADWEAGPDPDDPPSMLLWYLGWLEEELVTALMGSLDQG